MRRIWRGFIFAAVAVLIVSGIVLMSGCEEAKGLAGLTIDPSYVVLTSISNQVELVVVGNTNNALALPIEWRVTEPSLGYIAQTSGFKALYYRYSGMHGENTVIARDQYANEGYAIIRQIDSESGISLSATQADTNTWTISVLTPSSPPYEWWVSDPTLGTISSSGSGESAVYTARDTATENTVYARGNDDQISSVTIP